jgi:multiple sugar transport system substrate-binding protein
MKNSRLLTLGAFVATSAVALTGCAGGGAPAGEPVASTSVTLSYGLWDSNQLPSYEECAAGFTAANPDIAVTIEQIGWDDYWAKINNGFVSGDNYDVFTSHLAFFPEFQANEQILPLDDYIAEAGVDLSIYQDGLASLWTNPEGQQFGLPKDFDTIALFYNQKLADEAGITKEQLDSLTWNPSDGGTYEDIIARLTVDKNGVRGDEAGFDKTKVATYGIWMEGSGGGDGQTQWSFLTGTTGWNHTNGVWGDTYNYDDPRFQETIAWWTSLQDKGYMPEWKAQDGVNWSEQLAAGTVAMASNGSWMTGSVFGAASDSFVPAVAPTPVGPSGERSSMYNGLADNIWVGTDHPDEAAKWVAYLGSAECQDVVAENAVVFPAIKSSTEKAGEAFAAKGVDVNAFLVHVEEGTTFLFPITDRKSDVNALMGPAMEAIMSGQADPSSLTAVNDQVNALFN